MIVLGIDPGLANTGYGVVRRAGSRMEVLDHGTLRTRPSTPTEERLLALHDGLAGVIAANEADVASIEAFFVHPVSKAAMGMAAARGALLVACAHAGLAVAEYTPTAIKQAALHPWHRRRHPGQGIGVNHGPLAEVCMQFHGDDSAQHP